jgi:double-stranded uracil-DNA glycosylase
MSGQSPLRDRVGPGTRVLFVGINPGIRSARTGHHFAGYSNRFWRLLFESELVPEPLTHDDDERLPEFGCGLTNLVARATPGIGDLSRADYVNGRRRLFAKVRRHRPKVVALLGVTLYRALFDTVAEGSRAPVLGLRHETIEGVPVFVLPNPSGRNANYSYAEMLDAFTALAAWLRRQPRGVTSDV